MSSDLERMQLAGPRRSDALRRFHQQLAEWGLKMPDVEPLVLDFGLGDFDRVGLIECWLANEIQAGYCGKYLFVFDGQQCPVHNHVQKHETFFVVKGRLGMTVDNRCRTMQEGDLLAMPAGWVHSFTGVGNALILEVSTPCLPDDNRFHDPRIDALRKRGAS